MEPGATFLVHRPAVCASTTLSEGIKRAAILVSNSSARSTIVSTSSTETAAQDAHERTIRIIVNGEQKEVPSETMTYDEVVKLAYPTPPGPDTVFTVTYRNAEQQKEGSLVQGQSVRVKEDGTIFNVKATSKS